MFKIFLIASLYAVVGILLVWILIFIEKPAPFGWGFGAFLGANMFCFGLYVHRETYSHLSYLGCVIGFLTGIGMAVSSSDEYGVVFILYAFVMSIIWAIMGFCIAKGWANYGG